VPSRDYGDYASDVCRAGLIPLRKAVESREDQLSRMRRALCTCANVSSEVTGVLASRAGFCITRRYVSLVAWSIIHATVYVLWRRSYEAAGCKLHAQVLRFLSFPRSYGIVGDPLLPLFLTGRNNAPAWVAGVAVDYIIDSSLTVDLIVPSVRPTRTRGRIAAAAAVARHRREAGRICTSMRTRTRSKPTV